MLHCFGKAHSVMISIENSVVLRHKDVA